MKNVFQYSFLIICVFSFFNPLKSQNACLDLDGVDDYISTPLSSFGGSDFTVEVWFLSSNIPVDSSNLFSFEGGSHLYCYAHSGSLYIDWEETNSTIVSASLAVIPTNQWIHLALTQTGQTITVYLNCLPIWSGALSSNFIFSEFNLGRAPNSSVYNNWLGKVDNVQIWNFSKSQTQIDDGKHCVASGLEPGLELSWNFDEGIAGANNSGILFVTDDTGNHNGIFNNLALSGSTSNYVTSDAPIVYPNLNNAKIEIKDYPYQTALVTEICPGDPVHFSMLHNGIVPGPFNNVTVEWYYYDSPSSPHFLLTSPPFTDFRFGIPSGVITYDCSTSTDGFVDRTYYAISKVSSIVNSSICDYKSDEYTLRICCEISAATVELTPPDPICEDDVINITVNLQSSDPFVQSPLGAYTHITWDINGTYDPSYDDMITFPYSDSGPFGVLPGNYCFNATITNCNGKSASFESCIQIDKKPICGTIDALPLASPQNLTLVNTTPHKIYEICPDNDAIMGIDLAFQFCNPQWQYSFTNTPGSWNNLGYSNSVQNTNILPTASWSGTSIFYRIQCNPLSKPSGCDPCYSNIIEIRLKTAPIPNAIGGVSQLCKGFSNTLTVASPSPAHTYTWFCDGLQVGTGTSYNYSADKSACYWFESSEGCYVVESPQYCVTVCEVIPVLTCPILPNNCACLGTPITLEACASYSTCSNPIPNLQFSWYINNVLQPPSGCTITHTPPSTGASYRVEIVNVATGCSTSAEKVIVPCDKI